LRTHAITRNRKQRRAAAKQAASCAQPSLEKVGDGEETGRAGKSRGGQEGRALMFNIED